MIVSISKEDKELSYAIKHLLAIREHFDSIVAIKQAIRDDDLHYVVELWQELSNEEQQSLRRAPTKGGVFTIEEDKYMKSPEWKRLFFKLPGEE